MAAVLSPKQISFPHDILHASYDRPVYSSMSNSSSTKMSLPPISSLIEDVDRNAENASQHSPALSLRKTSSSSHGLPPSPDRPSFSGSPRSQMPPTPPLPGPASFDHQYRVSAGSVSPHGSISHSSYSPKHSAVDSAHGSRYAYPPLPEMNHWAATQSSPSRRHSGEQGQHETARSPRSIYPEPIETNHERQGLAQQRPLPVNFPPQLPSPTTNTPPIDPQASASYQHHHHYQATSPSAYQQITERYVCPTCQKAFSRPSSLKIHIYSHTGEKPFKCKYEGCGKHFSVRSNMKRHEKGCHGGSGGDSSSVGGNSPAAS